MAPCPSSPAAAIVKILGAGSAAFTRAPIPGEQTSGTGATFDKARKDFEAAWSVFLSKRTEADFQQWRDQRDFTAEKYRRFDRGERMPINWKPTRYAVG